MTRLHWFLTVTTFQFFLIVLSEFPAFLTSKVKKKKKTFHMILSIFFPLCLSSTPHMESNKSHNSISLVYCLQSDMNKWWEA